ncbi:MAG: glycoside hydrolase family 5 protein [Solirubrobacterales bacterium]|nr:glycoside hydrolase family 5 protein [Solirubrobacterales bacterium]
MAATVLPAAAAHASSGFLGGVNIPGLNSASTPAQADREIADARQLHARLVRADFSWSALEPSGPGLDPRALAFTDRLVADAEAAHIKIVATVASTPCWASSAPAAVRAGCSSGHSDGAGSWPPSNDAAYAAVLTALAQRYGSRLAAIEVWNEPDQSNEQYFAGPEKAVKYARLLRAAYPAVKSVAPGITVLGGSLVGSNGNFLKALYAAGIKGFYDGLSVHYYNLTLGSLRSIRETQTANGDAKPLWLDEFGWTSCWPGRKTEQEQACVTSKTQALNLRNALREMSRAPYLAAATVYKLQDSRAESFGALNGSGRHKRSFNALSEAFDNPLGPFSAVTLRLRRRGSQIIASGSGPVGDFMQLEAFQRGKLRFRALFIQNRFNEYSVAIPPVLGTSGLRVRVYQYWTGPSRAATKSV